MMLEYNGEHSIRFADSLDELYRCNPLNTYPRRDTNRHSWYNWYLIPEERYSVPPPELREDYVDIPGAQGALDYTEALNGYPTYKNIEGEMSFLIDNDRILPTVSGIRNKEVTWNTLYYDIKLYLHGKQRYMLLDDDPEWYYYGRFTVGKYDASDGKRSKIVISYNLEPFRNLCWQDRTVIGPFIETYLDSQNVEQTRLNESDIYWDAIDLNAGIVGDNAGLANRYLNPFQNVEINEEEYQEINNIITDYKKKMGLKPVIPVFTIEKLGNESIDLYIRYTNSRLGIAPMEIHIEDENGPVTYKNRQIIFTNTRIYNSNAPGDTPSSNDFTLEFKGTGVVSLHYEYGVL